MNSNKKEDITKEMKIQEACKTLNIQSIYYLHHDKEL